ncbi:MAG: hypothetical protein ACXQTX_00295, partial [Candidatus Syntropharchaeia archaeon]
LKVGWGYDSNVFKRYGEAMPGYPEAATIVDSQYLSLVSQLGVELSIEDFIGEVNYRIHLTNYQREKASRQSSTDYPEIQGLHKLLWRGSDRLEFKMEEEFKRTSEPIVQDLPQEWGRKRIKRFSNRLLGEISYRTRSDFLLLRGRFIWFKNDYEKRVEDFNYDQIVGIFDLNYCLLPKTTASFQIRFKDTLWDTAEMAQQKNFKSWTVYPSLSGQVTEKMGVKLALGYQGIFYQTGEFQAKPVGVLTVKEKFSPDKEGALTFERQVQPSLSAQTYTNNLIGLDGKWRNFLRRRLGWEMRLVFNFRQYGYLNPYDVEQFHFKSALKYKFGSFLECLQVAIEYIFEASRSEIKSYCYDDHVFGVLMEFSY